MRWVRRIHNKVVNADMLRFLKMIPDNYFDILLTDPPYGIDIIGQRIKKDPDSRYGYRRFSYKKWDIERPEFEHFKEMLRVSKNQIIWGGNYFADLLPASQGWLVWNKSQRDFSLADGELAWTSYDKALRIFDYSRVQALRDGKIHPTQKPVALFEWVLKLRAKKGDLILDCYSGSATTGIACQNLGFNFVCVEMDGDYYKQSVERLKQNIIRINEDRRQMKFIDVEKYEQMSFGGIA